MHPILNKTISLLTIWMFVANKCNSIKSNFNPKKQRPCTSATDLLRLIEGKAKGMNKRGIITDYLSIYEYLLPAIHIHLKLCYASADFLEEKQWGGSGGHA